MEKLQTEKKEEEKLKRTYKQLMNLEEANANPLQLYPEYVSKRSPVEKPLDPTIAGLKNLSIEKPHGSAPEPNEELKESPHLPAVKSKPEETSVPGVVRKKTSLSDERKPAEVPAGIEGFSLMRRPDKNYIVVDKSWNIAEILEGWQNRPILITRPRRFGKTTLLTMLQCFLDCGTELSTIKTMFSGMRIMTWDKCAEHMGKYYVVKLSLANIKDISMDLWKRKFQEIIVQQLTEYIKDFINRKQAECIEAIYLANTIRNTILETVTMYNPLKLLTTLVDLLYKYKGTNKLALLVDEYESPYLGVEGKPFERDVHDAIIEVYDALFKERAAKIDVMILVGLTPFLKEYMGSKANNIIAHTVESDQFLTCAGFTEEEIKEIVYMRMNFSEDMQKDVMKKLKEYFNGYCFGDSTTLYCPFSVMGYLQQMKGKSVIEVPNGDWTGTGRVSNLTDKLNADVKAKLIEILETLLSPPYHLPLPYPELKEAQAASYGKSNDIISALRVLYHYGYLTYNFKESRMQIPNFEIHCSLSYHFRQLVGYNIATGVMFKHLIEGKVKEFHRSLEKSLGCLSYFDFKERFYHAFVLGLIRMELHGKYFISSELVTGEGRSDVTAYKYDAKTDEIGLIIVELKHESSQKKEKRDKLAKEALEQIRSKGYGKELLGNYPSLRYVFVGAAFYKKAVSIQCKYGTS